MATQTKAKQPVAKHFGELLPNAGAVQRPQKRGAYSAQKKGENEHVETSVHKEFHAVYRQMSAHGALSPFACSIPQSVSKLYLGSLEVLADSLGSDSVRH